MYNNTYQLGHNIQQQQQNSGFYYNNTQYQYSFNNQPSQPQYINNNPFNQPHFINSNQYIQPQLFNSNQFNQQQYNNNPFSQVNSIQSNVNQHQFEYMSIPQINFQENYNSNDSFVLLDLDQNLSNEKEKQKPNNLNKEVKLILN
jgi:hypothetical protein